MIETRFKETEVGRIPEDWELDKLADKFEFRSNNTFSRDALSDSGSIQNVHYGDVLIKYGSHLDAQKDKVPYIADKNFRASVYISDGDVIMADTAEDETVGKATEVINVGHNQLVSGLHTMWLHPIVQERYAVGYLGYAFNASVYHSQLLPLMQGTKVTSVSKTAVKDTSILVPPKYEQMRIATALSNIDALISELGKLIEKKRDIKQGAMQQLLTGKKRLKGFTAPWVEKKLDEITDRYDNYRIPIAEAHREKGTTPYYGANGIQDYVKGYTHDGENILIAEDGANSLSDYPINYVEGKIWVNNHAHVLKAKDKRFDNKFLAYAFKTIDFESKIVGGSRAKLNAEALMELEVFIPLSPEEQSSIASVLSLMDEEISTLETKREKYIAIKQGMMQQLLTGKNRLID